METLTFDVMLKGHFVCTLHYNYSSLFPLREDELRNYVISECPTLRNRPFNIVFFEYVKKSRNTRI